MPDLRSQLIEAIEAALFVDGWEMGMAMDPTGVAATALDAMLDTLTEHPALYAHIADGYPDMYEVKPTALPHLEALGLLSEFSRVPHERIAVVTIQDFIAVLRPVVEEPK